MRAKLKNTNFNFKKLIIILLIISLLLISGGIFYLTNYFDANRLKRLVIPRLEENLKREVEIADIGLSFWPQIGINITQFKVHNSRDFENDYLLKLEELNLGVALRPLLSRELEVEQLSFLNPTIYLEKNQAKEINYQLDLAEQQEEDIEVEEEGIKLSLSMDNFQIEGGKIEYIDKINSLTATVEGVESQLGLNLSENRTNLRVDNLAFNSLDLGLEQDNFQLTDFSTNFILKLEENKIEVDDLVANLGNSQLSLAGSHSEAGLNFQLGSELALAELKTMLLPDKELDLRGNLSLNLAAQELDLATIEDDLSELSLNGKLGLEEVVIDGNAFPSPIERINGQLLLKENNISLEELQAHFEEADISSSLQIEDWPGMVTALLNEADSLPGSANIDLKTKGLDIEAIMNELEFEEEAEAIELPNFNLKAGIELEDTHYQNLHLNNVTANLYTEQGELIIDKAVINQKPSALALTGQLSYGDYLATQDLEYLLIDLAVEVDLNLDQLNEELIAFNSDFADYKLTGSILTDWELTFKAADLIDSPLDNLAQLDLSGNLVVDSRDINLPQLNDEVEKIAAKLALDNQELELTDLDIRLTESNLEGQMQLSKWDKLVLFLLDKEEVNNSTLTVDLNSELLAMEELLVYLPEEAKEEDPEQELDLDFISELSLNGQAYIQEFKSEKLFLEELGADFQLTNGLAEIQNLDFKLAEGRAQGEASLDLTKEEPTHQGYLILNQAEVNKILSSWTNFEDHIYGKTDLDLSFSGQSLEFEKLSKNLNLDGEVKINEGNLTHPEIVSNLNNWFNIFEQDSLEFKDLKGQVTLEEGKLYLNNFNTQTARGDIDFEGYSTLEGELNYELSYLLSPEASERLRLPQKEFFYGPDNEQIQLDFKLEGSVLKPEFSWDRSRAEEKIKEEAEKQKEKAKEKTEERVKDEIEELEDRVRDLF
ncbi:AsmA family protein [Fuchsiella alkaliacetigena]|uniref:AsmA family protein n=1 Tax=Fuchsiella alkaliacetigena TaxID=957042 RepID=UPI00200B36E7|nr:AsmA-like C-terminal region-containing protein [Fuchsiella alkaliacetigena]MCK8826042.1 AsmA family protein [Fuchsiella alkaliacetigena]